MGDEKAAAANKCSSRMIEMLRKKTHFSRQEIEALCRVFRKLLASDGGTSSAPAAVPAPAAAPGQPNAAPGQEGLNRVVFRELLHNTFDVVTEEVLMDRIFCAFDRKSDGAVRLDQWVLGLSVFLRGSLDERAAFTFLVYDLNSDGFITRDEMFHLLRNCLVKAPGEEDPDEGARELVELALRKLDGDRDGRVSFADFRSAVAAEPLLLEAFGQCLPSDAAAATFLSTLQHQPD